MDTIHDLYAFAGKHNIRMQDALKRASLGSNYAHRLRSKTHAGPHMEKFNLLRKALYAIAIENGTMPAGVDDPDKAGQIGAAALVRGEVAAIRESLERIEAAAGGVK